MNEDMLGCLTGHEARRRYTEDGVSSHDLALAAGVSQGETKRRLVGWGVFRTYAGDKLSPQLLTRHLAAGMSDQEIADAVGVTITTV